MSRRAAGGNGSQLKPFQTIVQARAIRSHRQAGTLNKDEAVTVYLEPRHPLNASLEFTAADSGTADSPVVYRARKSRTARLKRNLAQPLPSSDHRRGGPRAARKERS